MNKADPTPTDYNDLIAKHIQIAKDICGNNSEAWSKFFKIITENDGAPGYLPARYAQRMRDRNCAGEIVDFCSFLYDYLKKDNCYVLTNLIKSRQTFFSEYFRSVLKDAYAIFEKQYACEFAVIPIDGDVQRNLHEKLTAPAVAPVKRKLPTRTQRCYDTFRNVWKNNQLDYLTIYLGVALDFNYKYVAGLLGFGTANAVAKRVERFYRAD